MRYSLLLSLALFVSSNLAAEDNIVTIYSSAQPGAIPPELYRPVPGRGNYTGTVPGFAVVRHERDYAIDRGYSQLRVTDVAALIDPTTVMFKSISHPDTRVLEQSFEFDLVSNQKLLQRYLGQEIIVEQIRGETVDEIRGTLLGASDGLILQAGDGTVQTLYQYNRIRFPQLPGGLITRPTLVWSLDSKHGGQHRSRIAYQTNGMTWWADYNAVLDESRSCELDISAWVSIINQSGASYSDASLKLIAGDVHRAQPPGRMERMMVQSAVMEADRSAGFSEKEFFEYHLYTLGRKTDLPVNSTRQIELFPTAQSVDCEKEFIFAPTRGYQYYGGQYLDQNYGRTTQADVKVYLRFENEEDNQLGIPMPAGRVRVSQLDKADESLEFIGEDVIDHTPKDEQIMIEMGNAFDVVGERVQTDFRIDSRSRQLWETFEVKLRNHKSVDASVTVLDTMYRSANWEIQSPSHAYEKTDAHGIRFEVPVDKDGETVITYTVHYSW
jgi:hypothetical protein